MIDSLVEIIDETEEDLENVKKYANKIKRAKQALDYTDSEKSKEDAEMVRTIKRLAEKSRKKYFILWLVIIFATMMICIFC